MTHPPAGPSTPTPPAGPRVTGYVGMLHILEASLDGDLAVLNYLPEPLDADEANKQALLAFRLKLAGRAVRDLLAHIQSPARRDLSSAAVGAAADEITSTGGPAYITTLPSSATGRADQLPHFSWTVTFDPPLSWDWPC